MEQDSKYRNDVYSVKLKAGKRRTYFFDVRTTKNKDYFLTIAESKRLPNDEYERHKIFIYKEDFVKFVNTLQETVDYVKSELLPDFDFDNPNYFEDGDSNSDNADERPPRNIEITNKDKWS